MHLLFLHNRFSYKNNYSLFEVSLREQRKKCWINFPIKNYRQKGDEEFAFNFFIKFQALTGPEARPSSKSHPLHPPPSAHRRPSCHPRWCRHAAELSDRISDECSCDVLAQTCRWSFPSKCYIYTVWGLIGFDQLINMHLISCQVENWCNSILTQMYFLVVSQMSSLRKGRIASFTFVRLFSVNNRKSSINQIDSAAV